MNIPPLSNKIATVCDSRSGLRGGAGNARHGGGQAAARPRYPLADDFSLAVTRRSCRSATYPARTARDRAESERVESQQRRCVQRAGHSSIYCGRDHSDAKVSAFLHTAVGLFLLCECKQWIAVPARIVPEQVKLSVHASPTSKARGGREIEILGLIGVGCCFVLSHGWRARG